MVNKYMKSSLTSLSSGKPTKILLHTHQNGVTKTEASVGRDVAHWDFQTLLAKVCTGTFPKLEQHRPSDMETVVPTAMCTNSQQRHLREDSKQQYS